MTATVATSLAAVACAEAAGARLQPGPGGGVRLEADAPPPPEVLDGLRRHRNALAAQVAERAGRAASSRCAVEQCAAALAAPDPDLARERARTAEAMALEAAGAFGAPAAPDRHAAAFAGLSASAGLRPAPRPWAAPEVPPSAQRRPLRPRRSAADATSR